MNNRGNVLLHVLATGVVMAFVSALLLRMAMMRAQVTARAHNTAQNKRDDEAALAMIVSAWAGTSVPCQNNVPNYSCVATGGTCGCICTPTGGMASVYPTVTATGLAFPCTLQIVSTDLQR